MGLRAPTLSLRRRASALPPPSAAEGGVPDLPPPPSPQMHAPSSSPVHSPTKASHALPPTPPASSPAKHAQSKAGKARPPLPASMSAAASAGMPAPAAGAAVRTPPRKGSLPGVERCAEQAPQQAPHAQAQAPQQAQPAMSTPPRPYAQAQAPLSSSPSAYTHALAHVPPHAHAHAHAREADESPRGTRGRPSNTHAHSHAYSQSRSSPSSPRAPMPQPDFARAPASYSSSPSSPASPFSPTAPTSHASPTSLASPTSPHALLPPIAMGVRAGRSAPSSPAVAHSASFTHARHPSPSPSPSRASPSPSRGSPAPAPSPALAQQHANGSGFFSPSPPAAALPQSQSPLASPRSPHAALPSTTTGTGIGTSTGTGTGTSTGAGAGERGRADSGLLLPPRPAFLHYGSSSSSSGHGHANSSTTSLGFAAHNGSTSSLPGSRTSSYSHSNGHGYSQGQGHAHSHAGSPLLSPYLAPSTAATTPAAMSPSGSVAGAGVGGAHLGSVQLEGGAAAEAALSKLESYRLQQPRTASPLGASTSSLGATPDPASSQASLPFPRSDAADSPSASGSASASGATPKTAVPGSARMRKESSMGGTLKRLSSRVFKRSYSYGSPGSSSAGSGGGLPSPISPAEPAPPLPAWPPALAAARAGTGAFTSSSSASSSSAGTGAAHAVGSASASASSSSRPTLRSGSASTASSDSAPHTPQTPATYAGLPLALHAHAQPRAAAPGPASSFLSAFSLFGGARDKDKDKEAGTKHANAEQQLALAPPPSIASIFDAPPRLPQLPPPSLRGPDTALSQRRTSGAEIERSSPRAQALVLPELQRAPSQDAGLADSLLGDSDLLSAVLSFSFDSEADESADASSASYSHARKQSANMILPRGQQVRSGATLSTLGAIADSSLAADAFGSLRGLGAGWRQSTFAAPRLTEAQARAIQLKEETERAERKQRARAVARPGLFKEDGNESEDDYGDEADEAPRGKPTVSKLQTQFPSSFRKSKALSPGAGKRLSVLNRNPADWPGLDTPVKRALYNCTLLKVHPQLASIVKETAPETDLTLVETKPPLQQELGFPRSMAKSSVLRAHESTMSVQRNLHVALARSLVMRKLKRDDLSVEQEVEIGWFQRRYASEAIPPAAIAAAIVAKVSTKPEALATPTVAAAGAEKEAAGSNDSIAAWARRAPFAQRMAVYNSDADEPALPVATKAAPIAFSKRVCALAAVSNKDLLAGAPKPQRFRKREAADRRSMGASSSAPMTSPRKSSPVKAASAGRSSAREPSSRAPAPWMAPRDPSKRISRQAPVSPTKLSPSTSPMRSPLPLVAELPDRMRSAPAPFNATSPPGSPTLKSGKWSPTTSDDESEEEVPLSVLRRRRSFVGPQSTTPPVPPPQAPVPALSAAQRQQAAAVEQQRKQQAELDARLAAEALKQRKRVEEEQLRKHVRELKEARERRQQNSSHTLLAERSYGAGDPSRPSPSETIGRAKSAADLKSAAQSTTPQPASRSPTKRDSLLPPQPKTERRRSRVPSADEIFAAGPRDAAGASPAAPNVRRRSIQPAPPLLAAGLPSPGTMPRMAHGVPYHMAASPSGMPVPAWPYAHPAHAYAMPHAQTLAYHQHALMRPAIPHSLVNLQAGDVPRSATQHLIARQR